jgi:redox-sensitive bicupin YhaK (pirin superfamily)
MVHSYLQIFSAVTQSHTNTQDLAVDCSLPAKTTLVKHPRQISLLHGTWIARPAKEQNTNPKVKTWWNSGHLPLLEQVVRFSEIAGKISIISFPGYNPTTVNGLAQDYHLATAAMYSAIPAANMTDYLCIL